MCITSKHLLPVTNQTAPFDSATRKSMFSMHGKNYGRATGQTRSAPVNTRPSQGGEEYLELNHSYIAALHVKRAESDILHTKLFYASLL